MRAGQFRNRCTLQHKTVTGQDSFGQDVVSYTANTEGPFALKIEALQGRQLETARQTWAEARFRAEMRFQPGVTVKREDRWLWGTRVLDILDAEDPDQRKRRIIMYCKEIVE